MKTEKMNYFKNSLSFSKPLFVKLADSSRAVNSFAKFIQIILVLSYLPNLALIADLFILSSAPPLLPKHPQDGLGEITKGIYSGLKKETSPWQGHPQKNQGQSISLLEMKCGFSEEDSPGLGGSSAWEYSDLEGS